MKNKSQKEKIRDNIIEAKRGDFDESIANDISNMDSLADESLDITWIEALGQIYKTGFYGSNQMDSWRWDVASIATGQYPLKKLPEHVRDLAKTLYYNKKNSKKRSA